MKILIIWNRFQLIIVVDAILLTCYYNLRVFFPFLLVLFSFLSRFTSRSTFIFVLIIAVFIIFFHYFVDNFFFQFFLCLAIRVIDGYTHQMQFMKAQRQEKNKTYHSLALHLRNEPTAKRLKTNH